jgi:hypothetical protein
VGADRAWADWVAWELEAAGWPVLPQDWDFFAGDNYVARRRDALASAKRFIALYSQACFRSPECEDEWTAALLKGPDGRDRLVLATIDEATVAPHLLRTRVAIDLAGLRESEARASALRPRRPKPPRRPRYPRPGRRARARRAKGRDHEEPRPTQPKAAPDEVRGRRVRGSGGISPGRPPGWW